MSDIAIDAMDAMPGEDFFLEEEAAPDGAQGQAAEGEAPTTEPTTKAETEPETEPEGATPKAGIKVRYNHEDRELTLEEAKELAEKGLALDKTREELQQLRGAAEELRQLKESKALQVLDAYAARNTMTREQYAEYLERHQEKAAIQEAEEEIRAKHPEADGEIIREMAEMKVREQFRQSREAQDKNRAEAESGQQAKQQEAVRDWSDFLKEYPEINRADKIPGKVKEDIQAGTKPLEAMRKYELAQARAEIEELKNKLQAQEKNQQNRQATIGSVAENAGDTPVDAFFVGFQGG